MYYIEQRIQVICNQLAHFRFRESRSLPDWQYKKGQFFRPEEAEAASNPWEKFDCQTMRWYADYAGTDQFEGKFQGQSTDFHGIPGTHYWFRSRVTIPQDFAGKSVWLRIHTQSEEWDDGKNPQFLVFINGQVVQGADMNHREVLLSRQAQGGQTLDLDIQAYTGTLHREFAFLADLYVLDEEINHLYYDLLVPLQAFPRMEEDSKLRLDLRTVLNDTINLLDLRQPYSREFYASLRRAQAHIARELYTLILS